MKDGENINTVDKCNAFELVRYSCEVDGTDELNIEIVSLKYSVDLKTDVGGDSSSGGETGTSDYMDLDNKPSINKVVLEGNKTLNELGIQPAGNYLTEHQDISGLASTTYVNKQIEKAMQGISVQIDEINSLVGSNTEGSKV